VNLVFFKRGVFQKIVCLAAALLMLGAVLKAQKELSSKDEKTRQIIPVFEKARRKNTAKNIKQYLQKSAVKPRLRVARRQNSGLKSSIAQIRPSLTKTSPNSDSNSKQKPSDKKTPLYAVNKSDTDKFSLEKAQKIGLTLWKMEPATKNSDVTKNSENPRSVVHPVQGYVPTRVSSETFFRAGDKIRLSVESPSDGYLYVLNCEVYEDDSNGQPTLIFPTRQLRGGQNFLTAGSPIEFPAVTDKPSYFELRPNLKPKKVVAEALVFIVTKSPIENLKIPEQVEIVDKTQLESWQEKWAGKTEVWELEGENGKFYTQGEYESAIEVRSRGIESDGSSLNAADPEPQSLFAVDAPVKDGILFTLVLRYL
jgi:hypothetical protein